MSGRIVLLGITPPEWVPVFFSDVAEHAESHREAILKLHPDMKGEFDVFVWSAKLLSKLAQGPKAVSKTNGRPVERPHTATVTENTRFVVKRARRVRYLIK